MILNYFILGTLTSIIGALPIGTVNLAVIHTSMKQNSKMALPMIAAAGIGEVLLAILALTGSMKISVFLEKNAWIHILVIFLFLLVGLYLILIKKKVKKRSKPTLSKDTFSKYITGFLLAIFNPPVLMYWIASLAVANLYFVKLNSHTPPLLLILFFIGVYMGKILILYLYSLWGNRIARKTNTFNQKSSKAIGFMFILLSVFQGAKIWIW